MKNLQVLIVSHAIAAGEALVRALDPEHRWEAAIVTSGEGAIEQFCLRPFDVVITAKNWEADVVKKLKAVFYTHDSDVIIIDQKDHDHHALRNEIKNLWEAKRLERLQRITVNDTLNMHNLEQDIRLC